MVAWEPIYPGALIVAFIRRKKSLGKSAAAETMLFSIPLPYIAIQMGWLVTELGRQPWIVWGMLRTSAAGSPIAVSQVITTLVGFTLVYTLLGVAGYYLIFQHAKQGPASAAA